MAAVEFGAGEIIILRPSGERIYPIAVWVELLSGTGGTFYVDLTPLVEGDDLWVEDVGHATVSDVAYVRIDVPSERLRVRLAEDFDGEVNCYLTTCK